MKHIILLFAGCSAVMALTNVVGVGKVRDGYPLVVPQVQSLKSQDGCFVLPLKLTVSAPAALELTSLATIYAQTVPGGTLEKVVKDAFCRLELVDNDVSASSEGYTLNVTTQNVMIQAREIRGLYYGLQTLVWLLRNRETPNELKCCTINDWPDLEMRGFYLQLHSISSAQVDRICHVIDVLGSLKYNTLLLSFDDNFPFTGLPFTGRKTAPLNREDIAKLMAAARRNYLEVIPSVQLISHTRWMKNHRDWQNLREGNNDNGYCLSNPAVQPVVEQLVRDVIDLLKPRYFHIGLDEIEQGGLPACPKCKAGNLEELMLAHLRPILTMFDEKGITPIIYQDQFFGFGEPCLQRGLSIEKLPDKIGKNTIINTWEYWHFPSSALAETIRSHGFENLLYMSFAISTDNCQNLPKIAAQVGAKGNILAYWSMIPATFDVPDWPLPDFYPSFIAQANYCWNVSDVEFSRIPIDSALLMRELFDGLQERAFRGKATAVPLDGILNRAFANDPVFPVFDKETVLEMQRLAAADPAQFELKEKDGAPLAAVLSSCKYDGFATGPMTIPINTQATGASFLMTAAFFNKFILKTSVYDLRRIDIGMLRIVYADGQTKEIPLTYLRNINDWNTYIGGNACRTVLRGNDCNGALFSLYAIDWRNPRPEVEIKEIVMTAIDNTFISPVLFAISLSDATRPPVGAVGQMAIAAPVQRPEPKYEAAVNFHNGIPQGYKATGAGVRDYGCRLANDSNHGEVLEISMQECERYLARPLVDLPINAPRDFESVVFNLKISDPRAVFRPDFYVMDRYSAHALSATGFFLETDDQWHTVCIPRQRFGNDGGGIDPTKAEIMSLRFFMHKWKEPVKVLLDDIYYCDKVLPCRINITRPVK